MLERVQQPRVDQFTITVHREMPPLWPGVEAMGEARAHVFQCREFLQIWQRTFGVANRLEAFFVEIRDPAGELLMLLPLAIERRGGAKVLGFADQSTADYVAPVLYPTTIVWTPELAGALWGAIEKALPRADIVQLEKMPAEVGDCINPMFLLGAEANPESCHGSNLLRPWAEIEETQAQLKTLKRKARGLDKLGTVKFTVASDKVERDRILDRLLEQKQRRFEDTRVPGFAESPATKDFFVQATDVFAGIGHLHLAALEVGDEIIATSWTVSVGKTIYELMIGFESGEWAKHSGGRILNLRFLEWAKGQGYHYLDHGIGDEDWKKENCDTHVPLTRSVMPRTAAGRLSLGRARAMAGVRSWSVYEKLRPYKWIVKRALGR